ncbi:MAG TPA: hypothetical protein PKA19_15825 [Bacillota bacterium]|nr:hypothetical protein [Bacillota bacterium]
MTEAVKPLHNILDSIPFSRELESLPLKTGDVFADFRFGFKEKPLTKQPKSLIILRVARHFIQ